MTLLNANFNSRVRVNKYPLLSTILVLLGTLTTGTIPTIHASDVIVRELPDHLLPTQADLSELLREIEALSLKDAASLDAVRDPQDLPAIREAEDYLANLLIESAKSLALMKQVVINFASYVDAYRLPTGRSQEIFWWADLTKNYVRYAQAYYDQALQTLIRTTEAQESLLKKCVTQSCVWEISYAFNQIRLRAHEQNRSLKFTNLPTKTTLFWDFTGNDLITYSLRKAFRDLVPVNQDVNSLRVLAAGLYAPMAFVGTTAFNLVRNTFELLMNPHFASVRFELNEVDLQYSKYRNEGRKLYEKYRDLKGLRR